MSIARVICTAMLLALLPLITINCQLGLGAQPAAPPAPPPLPTPTASDQKTIDGYLHVNYIPTCALSSVPFHWVAPIRLTDLRSGSVIYLNRNGTAMDTPKPDYKTGEGKAVLEAALMDNAIVEQIVARPECPEKAYEPEIRQQEGWPNAYAEDIGDPPMPRVVMGTWPKFAESPPPYGYPGWRGAYCWPVGGNARECEDDADWKGFGSAEALEPGRFYVTVLGDDANPGTVRRVRVFPAQEKRANRGRSRELQLGAEVHRVAATSGETLDKFILPKLPEGDYMLIADYESPLGEVEYGFKVEVQGKRE